MATPVKQLELIRELQSNEFNSTLLCKDDTDRLIVVRSVQRSQLSDSWLLQMEHESKRLSLVESAYFNAPLYTDEDNKQVSITYPWVPGTTLARWYQQRRSTLTSSSLLSLFLDVAEGVLCGLTAVHKAGFVHRDVRPSHIVRSNEKFVLCGYGPLCVANTLGNTGELALEFAAFASPELAGSVDHNVSCASDLYSLGAVLYSLLYGRTPYQGNDVGEILFQHLTVSPSFEGLICDVPDQLLQYVARLLEKDVRDRYQSAESALRDVRSIRGALKAGEDLSKVTIGRHDLRSELTEPSFVGRTQEMAVIKNKIDSVADGEHKTLIAVGKSGMGKSRLLLEAIRVASRSGFTIYRSVATDQATQEPLAPLLTIIDSFANHLSTNERASSFVAQQLIEYQGEIATAMPTLTRVLGWESAALKGPEELGQGRVAVAFCKVLELCSYEGPTMIVVDDCQWLDKPSLRVLSQFSASKPANVFLLVGSRPNEGLSEQLREELVTARMLEFGELTSVGIHALVESMSGPLPAVVKDSVTAMCAGSPFIATAAMRGLVECEALVPAADGWKVDQEKLNDFQAAGDSANVLLKRLEFVDTDALKILSIGSVIGKQFDIRIAMELAELAPDHTFSRIQLVRDQGLIWSKPDGTIAFVHDKIREAIVARLSDQERSQIHRRVAEYLSAHAPERSFDLAFHYDAAKLPLLAWPHALNAAAAARSRYALDAAEAQYRIATHSLRQEFSDWDAGESVALDQGEPSVLPDSAESSAQDIALTKEEIRSQLPTKADRYEIQSGLAEILLLLAKYEEAEFWLNAAVESAPSPSDLAHVRLKQGDLAFKRGDKGQATECFEQALIDAGHRVPQNYFQLFRWLLTELFIQTMHSLFPQHFVGVRDLPSEQTRMILRIYSKLGHCYWYVKDQYQTLWAHLRGLNSAEHYKQTPELAQAYSEHAPAMSLIPWQSRGLDYARRSLQIRKDNGDVWGQGQSRNFLSIMFYSGAKFEECMNQAHQAIAVLERTGDYWEVHMAQYQAAAALYRLGRLKEAAAAAKALYESARKRGDEQSSGNATDLWARASLGRVPDEIIELETSRTVTDHQGRCHLYLAEGVQHHMAGRFDAAIATFNKALQAVKRTGVMNAYITPNYAWLATSLRHQYLANPPRSGRKNRRQIKTMLRASRKALLVSFRFHNELPHAYRELAAAHALAGNTSRAFRLYARSINAAERHGAVYEAAQSRLAFAELRHELRCDASTAEDLKRARDAVQAIEESVAHSAESTSLSLIDRFEVLLDAGRQITAANAVDDILEETLRASERLLRGDRVLILEESTASQGKPAYSVLKSINGGDEFDVDLVTQSKQAHSPEIARTEHLLRHGIQSEQSGAFLAAPIRVNEQSKYFLYVANTHITGIFGSDEVRIANYLTSAASGALERSSGYEQLEALNESLERRVQERTEAVVRHAEELQATANALRQTKTELEVAKEAAEKASASKSDFLACMSHEIRTPMSAVLGFTEILRTHEVTPEQQTSYLKRIHTNGEHLLALLNDVLDFSKIEASKLQIERVRCRPIELVHDAVAACASKAEAKGIDLVMSPVQEFPEKVVTDPTRLRQILMNLVGNAIKFTNQGHVRVEVSFEGVDDTDSDATREDPVRPMMRIDVIDTGIGISPMQLEKIFSPFTQADVSTSRQFGGTGLGLSISKSLAEALGGDIEIASKVDKGSTFTVRIETGSLEGVRWVREAEGTTETPESTVLEKKRLQGAHVLVVDDVEANRELISFLLADAGAKITCAVNGREAVDHIQAGLPTDIVFMDMQMPILDGYAATAELRRAGCKLPIIAMTAHTMKGDQGKCLSVGCDDYVAKPVDFEALLATAGKYFDPTSPAASPRPTDASKELGTSTETPTRVSCPNENANREEHEKTDELPEENPSKSEATEPVSDDFQVEYRRKLMELGAGFLQELVSEWDEFEQAVADEDYDKLKALAHRTKGTGATFGFENIAATMQGVEDAIAEKDYARVTDLISDCHCDLQTLVQTD